MRKKNGFFLLDTLFGVLLSSFVMLAAIDLLYVVASHNIFIFDTRNVWNKGMRLLLLIEGRVNNAGLGVPKNQFIHDVFRYNGVTPLAGWKDVIEVLDNYGVPVGFNEINGEQISRGTQLRVLSTIIAMPEVSVIGSHETWGKNEVRTFEIRKPLKYSIDEVATDMSSLESWMTMPSFGRPFIFQILNAPFNTESGSITCLNPVASMDWGGVDMLQTFRFAYFFVDRNEKVLYIKESDDKDTAAVLKYPVENGILAVCFELNKTKKILTAWFLIQSSSLKAQENYSFPSWSNIPPSYLKNSKVIKGSWNILNF